MKTIIKKYVKVLMVALMLLIPLGINNSVVYAEAPANTYELKKGQVYYIGDTIQLSGVAWVAAVEGDYQIPIRKGNYKLPEPWGDTYSYYWSWVTFFPVAEDPDGIYGDDLSLNFRLQQDDFDINNPPTGIQCVEGNGTEGNPFRFELVFDAAPSSDPTVIDTIEFTITPPVPGTSTKLAIPNNFESQTNPPIVSIPNGVDYYLNTGEDNEYLGAYWVDEMDVEEPFEDTFKVNNNYLANIYLKSNTGHVFSEDVTINITNGSLYDNFFMDTKKDYISIIAYVKCVEHHKVTFDANGGTIDGAKKKEISVVDGKVFTWDELPEPNRAGKYMFYGWCTDKACTNYFNFSETQIKSNITLYAKWIECSVVDLGEGSIWGQSILKMPLENGHKEPIPSEEELLGMDFKAPKGMRYVGVNIEGRQYKPGDVYKVKHNVMASVVYLPEGDILTFDLDGGTLGNQKGVAFFSYPNGQTIELPKPTKSGATFDYWQGSKYYAGDPYTVVGDKSFKAVWKPSPTPKPNYSIPKTGIE